MISNVKRTAIMFVIWLLMGLVAMEISVRAHVGLSGFAYAWGSYWATKGDIDCREVVVWPDAVYCNDFDEANWPPDGKIPPYIAIVPGGRVTVVEAYGRRAPVSVLVQHAWWWWPDGKLGSLGGGAMPRPE